MPNLRFPEFSGEWEKIRVSDLLEFFSTNSLSWDQLEYGGTDIFNLHYGLIHSGLSTQISLKKSILPSVKSEYRPRNYTLCEDGDVAFADASEDTNEVGKVVEFVDCAGKEIVCGLHTIHGRDKLGKTVVGFKGYAFSSPAFHNQIRRIAQGTKIFSINTGNFEEIFIGVPQKEEQDKISHLLSLLDQRIAIQNRIIEDLKKLRTTLNNRFHNSFGEGVVTCFEELGKSYSGLSGKGAEDFEKGYPFITYTNVFNHSFISDEDMGYVRIKAEEHQNHVEHGDLLLTLSSETPEEVGIGAVYLGNRKPLYLNSFCIGIHINRKDIVLPTYLPYLVESKMFRKFIFPLAQGSTRYNLQKSDFEKKKIVLPTLEAQISITRILDSITSKLSLEQEILTKLLMSKNALLSKMFI